MRIDSKLPFVNLSSEVAAPPEESSMAQSLKALTRTGVADSFSSAAKAPVASPPPPPAPTPTSAPTFRATPGVSVERAARAANVDSVLSAGYAPTNPSYADANYQLSQEVKALAASARGANWNGDSVAGRAAQAKIDALLKSWDPHKATFDGYVPGKHPPPEDERARRARAGLDDAGNLLPGFSQVKVAQVQRKTRMQVFLDHAPLSTKRDFVRFMNQPLNSGERRMDQAHGGDAPFSINYLRSANWGVVGGIVDKEPLTQQQEWSRRDLERARRGEE